jgi:arylsulfatase A-like enzyme
MIDHDKNVGELLDHLDKLGIAENTFVMYSTDNGPHRNSWPDGGMTPFRSEKNTNWEGAFRIPLIVRWPGQVTAGEVATGIVQHHDWLPTFLEMAGAPHVVEKLKKGYEAIGRTYKNHIDGFSLLDYITGKEKESPRKLFVYISDDGDVLALRYDNWKVVFMEQTLPRYAAGLGGTVHAPAPAEDLQLAHGSVRICRRHVKFVLRVVPVPRLHPVRRLRGRGQVRGDVQGLPGDAETKYVHDR